MRRVRLELSGDLLNKLESEASIQGLDLKEYVYLILGGKRLPKVTDLVAKAREWDRFTFTDIIKDYNLSPSIKAVLGRKFKVYVQDHPEVQIVEVGRKNNRIVYQSM